MKRSIFILMILGILLLDGRAAAALALSDGGSDEEPSTTSLPQELKSAAPWAAELVEKEEENSLAAGAATLWNRSLEEMKDYLLAGVKGVAAIMAGVLLLGVVESTAPQGKSTILSYTAVVGTLWITAVSAGDLNALIGLGKDTITEISQLSKVLLPSLAAATAASGGVTAASVSQVAAVFFSDILLTLIERILLPAVYLYIGLAAAGAVLEGDPLAGIGALLKKGITWALSGSLILFTTYLSISGAVAGATDAAAVKVARSAISGAVPVVGKILADATESVLAGAGILRGMIGVFGTLAVLGFCLTPFLRLGMQYLLYQGAALVAATAGPKALVDLLGRLGDAFGLVLAMTAASAMLLLVSLVSSLTAVAS